jgi:cytidylate kinase
MAYIVAIDGTAGSGKGTITKLVAEKLKMINIDTGIIYRSITLDLIKNNIDINNLDQIEEMLNKLNLSIKYENNQPIAILDNIDVTNHIRTNEVNKLVSKVAGLKMVRDKANELIRTLANTYLDKDISIIMEGRDITTVVFPNALVKIYMDASIDERARRRVKQNEELGIVSSFEEIKKSIAERDYNDMHHEFGALRKTEDAIYLDTTNMDINEVTNKIIHIIEDKLESEVK